MDFHCQFSANQDLAVFGIDQYAKTLVQFAPIQFHFPAKPHRIAIQRQPDQSRGRVAGKRFKFERLLERARRRRFIGDEFGNLFTDIRSSSEQRTLYIERRTANFCVTVGSAAIRCLIRCRNEKTRNANQLSARPGVRHKH